MDILINNHTLSVDKSTTLFHVLEQQGFTQIKGIAVALNDEVCTKDDWINISLKPNAHITIIKASQGG